MDLKSGNEYNILANLDDKLNNQDEPFFRRWVWWKLQSRCDLMLLVELELRTIQLQNRFDTNFNLKMIAIYRCFNSARNKHHNLKIELYRGRLHEMEKKGNGRKCKKQIASKQTEKTQNVWNKQWERISYWSTATVYSFRFQFISSALCYSVYFSPYFSLFSILLFYFSFFFSFCCIVLVIVLCFRSRALSIKNLEREVALAAYENRLFS